MDKVKLILVVLLLIGIADASYLTVVHYLPASLVCPKGSIVNCEQVVTSSFSEIMGIPISLGGIVWCVILLGLVLYKKTPEVLRNIWLIFGLGAVLYSVSGQLVLQKICEYCMLLDVIIVVSVFLVWRYGDRLK